MYDKLTHSWWERLPVVVLCLCCKQRRWNSSSRDETAGQLQNKCHIWLTQQFVSV
jgi:hypothetical protein